MFNNTFTIPEGTILQSLNISPNSYAYLADKQDMYLYDPSIEHDRRAYEGFFSLIRARTANWNIFIHYFKVRRNLKLATPESLFKIYKKLYRKYDYIFNKDLRTYKGQFAVNKEIANYQIQELKHKTEYDYKITFAMFIGFMNRFNHQSSRMFFDEVRKKYDGMMDVHNQLVFMQVRKPLIIFDPSDCLFVYRQPHQLSRKEIEKSFLGLDLTIHSRNYHDLSSQEYILMMRNTAPYWLYRCVLAKGFEFAEKDYPEENTIIPKGTILKCICNDEKSENCFNSEKGLCLFEESNEYDNTIYKGLISAEKCKGDYANQFREQAVYEHTFITRHDLILPKETHKKDTLVGDYGKDNKNHEDFYDVLSKLYDATINDIDLLKYGTESAIVVFDPAETLDIADEPHKMKRKDIIENWHKLPLEFYKEYIRLRSTENSFPYSEYSFKESAKWYVPQWLLDTIEE